MSVAIIMDENRTNYILRNAKMSMEVEGFVIDSELEEIGRKILAGDIDVRDYIEQIKQEAMEYAV